ncbi:MAG: flagellar hook-basal body complex protein [Candidatus Omnitrophica bacterium]|nr:flagellar hook-basal body complex protein [Candidatus Omnitrophota bacterium]
MSRALWAGVTGLSANAFKLDVIGNNIANLNTTGFKAGRALFGDLLKQTLSGGTASISGGSAGINPVQVGTGVKIMGVDTDFTQGAFLTTDNVTDLAVAGNGFFILNNGSRTVYTRDGAFGVDNDGAFISPFNGYNVQGWQAVDGVITSTGVTGDITVPLGTDTVSNATSTVTLVGNLDSTSTVDGVGTTAVSGSINDDGNGGAAAVGATLLVDLENGVGTNANLETGDYITVSASKGSGNITARTFTIGTTGTTLAHFAAFLEDSFGIVPDTNTAATEGVTIAGGQISLQGNIGTANAITAITITATDVGGGLAIDTTVFNSLLQADGFNGFTESTAAVGESSFTQMTVYDSLGVAHTVDAIFARADASANNWSFFATGDDNFLAGTRGTELLATAGSLTFATTGAVSTFTGNQLSMNLQTGATTPLAPTISGDQLTQFGTTSAVSLQTQDGFPPGTLESITIAASGIITGIYSNGLTQNIAQIAMSSFTNEDGLLAAGENLYLTGVNSGTPSVGTPGSGGRGSLNSGFLEQSNVDLARQFSDLIIAQRAYQASARTISAADALLAEAVNLV